MRKLLLLVVIVLALYVLYTNGTLSSLLPDLPAPNTTPEIIVTVHPVVIDATSTPAFLAPASPTVAIAAPTDLPPALPTAEPPTPTPTPLPPPTIIIPEVPPTLAVSTTPTPSSSFTLTVESPHDGDTLRFSPALVIGQTQANALVSVNDTIGFADANGRFSLSVPLTEGPNVLEVIASNTAGEQVFVILTVLYQP